MPSALSHTVSAMVKSSAQLLDTDTPPSSLIRWSMVSTVLTASTAHVDSPPCEVEVGLHHEKAFTMAEEEDP